MGRKERGRRFKRKRSTAAREKIEKRKGGKKKRRTVPTEVKEPNALQDRDEKQMSARSSRSRGGEERDRSCAPDGLRALFWICAAGRKRNAAF